MSRICHSSLQMPVTGPRRAMARRPIHEPRSRLKVRSESCTRSMGTATPAEGRGPGPPDPDIWRSVVSIGERIRTTILDGLASHSSQKLGSRSAKHQFQTAGTSCACANAGTAHAIDYAACGRVRRRSGNPARLTSTIRCRRSGRQSAVHCRHDCRRPTTRLCGVG